MQRWTRGSALRGLLAACALAAPGAGAVEAEAAGTAAPSERETPLAAVARLSAGNARYARDAAINCNKNYHRRAEVVEAQMPFAVVLGCADSRVPPEVLFDQRLGDLFVVRVAGNVADDVALGSIEYAVEHFHPALVLVLGHEKCGAVAATLEALAAHAEPAGFVGSIVARIMPAAGRARGEGSGALQSAVRENVVDVVRFIRSQSAVTATAERGGALRIAGATYSLSDGRVTFL